MMTVVRVMGNFYSFSLGFPVFSTPSTRNPQLFDNQKTTSNLAFWQDFDNNVLILMAKSNQITKNMA